MKTEEEKYNECLKRLKNKIPKKSYSKREEGFEEGILTAISIFRSIYKPKEKN